MKFKIFALLLTLILVIGCFCACNEAKYKDEDTDNGKSTDSVELTDTADSSDTSKISDTEALTGAITGGSENSGVTKQGKLTLTAEVVGDQLVAKVNLSDNPGVAGFHLRVDFDNTKLCPVAITDSELVDCKYIYSPISKEDAVLSDFEFVNAFYFNPSNFTKDGLLFSLTFDILDGASGETELTLACEDGDNTNENLEDVIFELENCKVNLG